MTQLEVKAPAKINIYLDVLGKRADGYHDIRSLLLPVSLFDRLILEERPNDIEMIGKSLVHFEGIPWPISMGPLEDNLIIRAARLLKEITGIRRGVRIILEKHIPIAAGLGGGSSNAAAVLNGLNTLWDTGLSQDEILTLGTRLGSDIPALIHGGAIEMNGRGDRIRPIRQTGFSDLWLVLVNPGLCISTGDIYSRYTPGLTPSPGPGIFPSILSGLEDGSLDLITAGLFNALQKTVFQKYSLLEIIHNELEKINGKGVLLSGTGSTVFALVKNHDQGHKLETQIRGISGCPLWTCVTHTVKE